MTDEELATIKRRMDTPHFYMGSVPAEIEDALTQDARDIGALLSEVERLQAENAALREFMQIVADNSYASERDLVESARALLGDGEDK